MIPSKSSPCMKQVICFVFLIISSVMLVISMSSSHWLEGHKFRRGLWGYCLLKPNGMERCHDTTGEMWITSCGVLCIVSFVFIFFSILFQFIHLVAFRQKAARRTSLIFLIIFVVLSLCSLLSCLVAFPVIFIRNQLEFHQSQFKIFHWTFSWSYGLAWGAFIFLSGAFTLIFLDPLTYYDEQSKQRGRPRPTSGDVSK